MDKRHLKFAYFDWGIECAWNVFLVPAGGSLLFVQAEGREIGQWYDVLMQKGTYDKSSTQLGSSILLLTVIIIVFPRK